MTKLAGIVLSVGVTLLILKDIRLILAILCYAIPIYITYLVIRLLKAKINESENRNKNKDEEP